MYKLIDIINSDEHLMETYKLLDQREFSISHKKVPTFEEHRHFFENSPYRFWFLLSDNGGSFVGTVYIQHDNSIGIFLPSSEYAAIPEILDFIIKEYTPLPAIQSQRNGEFFLNIPAKDLALQKMLIENGALEIQRSFIWRSR